MELLGMVLAGGKGTRLYPLTEHRAKPAVPFGGKYRIIDFVLSNFINSQIYSIFVLTQFKSQSLTEHIQEGWTVSSLIPNHFVIPVPAQMRTGEKWYQGTADAIYQNLNLIKDRAPRFVAVFGGDHIYKMDIRQMIYFHKKKNADATIATIPVPIENAHLFGVLQIDEDWKIIGFHEKPQNPIPIPGKPNQALISMGNYIFNRDVLIKYLEMDAERSDSSHDFGKDVLPEIMKCGKLYAYDFNRNIIHGQIQGEQNFYWRDVGNLDAYWEANMDIKDPLPKFNLYNLAWPIHTAHYTYPPAKFISEHGVAINSVVCDGCVISSGRVINSILGRYIFIDTGAIVENSILMEDVRIGKNARIRNAIIDKHSVIGDDVSIGYDLEQDRTKYVVSQKGIIALPKYAKIME